MHAEKGACEQVSKSGDSHPDPSLYMDSLLETAVENS